MLRFVTALALVFAFSLADTARAGKKDDTLVWATDRENSITDSSYLNTRELVIIGSLISDRLVHLNDKYEPVPLLATSWKWVNDTTLDFDLRKGVKFHNGKELDADDVVYTINFILDRDHGSLNYTYIAFIKQAEKLDSHKVRLHFNKPFPTALVFLAGAPNILAKGSLRQRAGQARWQEGLRRGAGKRDRSLQGGRDQAGRVDPDGEEPQLLGRQPQREAADRQDQVPHDQGQQYPPRRGDDRRC
jgi:hypothetical protein